MRDNRVISVSNQKGGVGKTTTVLNLGAALKFSGKKHYLSIMTRRATLPPLLAIRQLNKSIHWQISFWQLSTTRRIWSFILGE